MPAGKVKNQGLMPVRTSHAELIARSKVKQEEERKRAKVKFGPYSADLPAIHSQAKLRDGVDFKTLKLKSVPLTDAQYSQYKQVLGLYKGQRKLAESIAYTRIFGHKPGEEVKKKERDRVAALTRNVNAVRNLPPVASIYGAVKQVKPLAKFVPPRAPTPRFEAPEYLTKAQSQALVPEHLDPVLPEPVENKLVAKEEVELSQVLFQAALLANGVIKTPPKAEPAADFVSVPAPAPAQAQVVSEPEVDYEPDFAAESAADVDSEWEDEDGKTYTKLSNDIKTDIAVDLDANSRLTVKAIDSNGCPAAIVVNYDQQISSLVVEQTKVVEKKRFVPLVLPNDVPSKDLDQHIEEAASQENAQVLEKLQTAKDVLQKQEAVTDELMTVLARMRENRKIKD